MGDFWTYLAPWLISAVALPAWIVLYLKIMPSDEWAEGVIRRWADSQGLRVEEIDDFRWFGLLSKSGSFWKSYRVRVMDEDGRERKCQAVVGRLLLWETQRNISITWIKTR